MRFENLDTLEVSKLPITNGKTKVYRHPSMFTSNEENWYGIIPTFKKDKKIENGQDVEIRSFDRFDASTGEIYFSTHIGEEIKTNIANEKLFLESTGFSEDEFKQWLLDGDDAKDYFKNNQFMTVEFVNNRLRGSISKFLLKSTKLELIAQIKEPKNAYTVKIYDRNDGGFFCKINNTIECYMPGSLAAANRIYNFDELLGKEVIVMIEGYQEEKEIFIVSHKKYISHILPSAISNLNKNDEYQGKITGVSKHGIFIEFENIFTGLISPTEMNEDLSERYTNGTVKQGDLLSVYVTFIDKQNRISLSTISPELRKANTQDSTEVDIPSIQGRVVFATVQQIKPFGAFVKIAEVEQWCLLPQKEISKNKSKLKVGDSLYLSVNEINVQTGKISMKFIK